jgi:uncharacterized protein YkwD
MARAAHIALLGLSLSLVIGSCKDTPSEGPSVGTNSNWLRACADDGECGELPACECGACTIPCANDGDCDTLDAARCVAFGDPAGQAACVGEAPATSAGMCLPRCEPGSCSKGQACVDSACVLAPLPDVPLCTAVAERTAALRTLEDALLALMNELRTAGGTSCAGGAAQAAAPALRFDPRLLCAARVLAADLAATGMRDLTDAEGRDTGARLRAAGYAPGLWSESFALDARSAERARDLILMDTGSCMRLFDPTFTEIGVGSADGVLVVTLAAP